MTAPTDRVGRVQTVLGLIDPADLGPVMMHEHLLLDIRCLLEPAPAYLGPDFARDQLVVAQDICFKTMTVAYGGWGYAHILRRVVPGFRALGASEADLDAILVANPRRLLTFVSPPA